MVLKDADAALARARCLRGGPFFDHLVFQHAGPSGERTPPLLGLGGGSLGCGRVSEATDALVYGPRRSRGGCCCERESAPRDRSVWLQEGRRGIWSRPSVCPLRGGTAPPLFYALLRGQNPPVELLLDDTDESLVGFAGGPGLHVDFNVLRFEEHPHDLASSLSYGGVERRPLGLLQRRVDVERHDAATLGLEINEHLDDLCVAVVAGVEERCAAQIVPEVQVQLLLVVVVTPLHEQTHVIEDHLHHPDVLPGAGHVERGEPVVRVLEEQERGGVVEEEAGNGVVALLAHHQKGRVLVVEVVQRLVRGLCEQVADDVFRFHRACPGVGTGRGVRKVSSTIPQALPAYT